MSVFDPVFLLPLGLVTFVGAVVGTTALMRAVRARRRAKRRIVEKPNSHYSSQLARESEAKYRWHNMALDRIHEINRAEVVRLLAKVEATGVEALRSNERTFLDYMAELAGTKTPVEFREKGKPIAPELRHRPA